MTQLQQEINRLRTLQESLSELTEDYNSLKEGVDNAISLTGDVTQGKEDIAAAINAKGGTADPLASFQQLAQDIVNIPIIAETGTTWAEGQKPTNLAECVVRMQTQLKSLVDDSTESISIDNFLNYIRSGADLTFSKLISNTGQDSFSYCTLKNVYFPLLVSSTKKWLFRNSTIKSLNLPSFTSGFTDLFTDVVFQDELKMPSLTSTAVVTFNTCTLPKKIDFSSLSNLAGQIFFGGGNADALEEMILGTITFTQFANFFIFMPSLRKLVIGADSYSVNGIQFSRWTATNVIAEGQSGIDELNTNIQTYIAPNLRLITTTKTIYFGTALYNVLTAETLQSITDRGWTATGL